MRVGLSSPIFPLVNRLLDGVVLFGAAWLAYLVSQGLDSERTLPFFTEPYLQLVVAGCFLHLVFTGGLYRSWRGSSFTSILVGVVEHWVAVSALLLVWLFAVKSSEDFSRLWFGLWILFGAILLSLQRVGVYLALRMLRKHGRNSREVAIFGDEKSLSDIQHHLEGANWSGYRIVLSGEKLPDHIQRLESKVDEIWIAFQMHQAERIKETIYALRHLAVVKRIIPDLFTLTLMRCGVSDVCGVSMLNLAVSPFTGDQKLVKYLEDKVLGALIFLLILPLGILIAIGIKLTSPGPVFFAQKRLGLNNKVFMCYKFRTMKIHTEPEGKVTQAAKGDPRITPLGRFLRRTSLDELPQFFNVLLGEMSIVGPRPHALEHNDLYKDQVEEYMHRHLVKPGITGWAQVNGYRGETDTIYKMEKRVEYDNYYIQNWSLMLDIKIILMTMFKGFFGKNAY